MKGWTFSSWPSMEHSNLKLVVFKIEEASCSPGSVEGIFDVRLDWIMEYRGADDRESIWAATWREQDLDSTAPNGQDVDSGNDPGTRGVPWLRGDDDLALPSSANWVRIRTRDRPMESINWL